MALDLEIKRVKQLEKLHYNLNNSWIQSQNELAEKTEKVEEMKVMLEYTINTQLMNDKLIDELRQEIADLKQSIEGPEITAMTFQMGGTINGHYCEIRGFVPRSGVGHPTNPPGMCMICKAMINCETTEMMKSRMLNCSHIGGRGHIVSLHPEVSAITKSKEYNDQIQ